MILTWIYRRIPQTKKYIPLRISYALIKVTGAFGNLIDRVFRGYVVDFFILNGSIFQSTSVDDYVFKINDITFDLDLIFL